MKQPIIMRDGSPAEDEDISFLYEEDGKGNTIHRHLDYVMDFSQHFPYWEELPKPEGCKGVEKIDDVWYWIIEDKLSSPNHKEQLS